MTCRHWLYLTRFNEYNGSIIFTVFYLLGCSIIAQERLNRITQFVSEMSQTDYVPSIPKTHDQMHESVRSPEREARSDWMATAIPVDSAVTLAAAAAGIILEDEIRPPSPKLWEPQSPESITPSEALDFSQLRDIDKDASKHSNDCDDYGFEASGSTPEKVYGSCESSLASPEVGTSFSSRVRTLERLGSSESLFRW